jgi:hypothetical protein
VHTLLVDNLLSIKPKSIALAFQRLMSGASFDNLMILNVQFKRSLEKRCCITMQSIAMQQLFLGHYGHARIVG